MKYFIAQTNHKCLVTRNTKNIRFYCKSGYTHARNANEHLTSSAELYEKLKVAVNEANASSGDEELIKIWERVKHLSKAYQIAKQNELQIQEPE